MYKYTCIYIELYYYYLPLSLYIYIYVYIYTHIVMCHLWPCTALDHPFQFVQEITAGGAGPCNFKRSPQKSAYCLNAYLILATAYCLLTPAFCHVYCLPPTAQLRHHSMRYGHKPAGHAPHGLPVRCNRLPFKPLRPPCPPPVAGPRVRGCKYICGAIW